MNEYVSMLTEVIFGFFMLLLLTKILGKTQISQITAFDFISVLVLGELMGNALFDPDAGILEIGYVIIIWGTLMYFTEMVTQKFKRTRSMLEGNPSIVISKGKLMYDIMKKNKLDMYQLNQLLRQKDTFSVQEVEYAILEADGTLSVMKKAQFQTPTKFDMKLPQKEGKLSRTLINDGEIVWDNLDEATLTEEWLMKELKKQDFTKLEDVFHAEYTEGKTLFIEGYNCIDY